MFFRGFNFGFYIVLLLRGEVSQFYIKTTSYFTCVVKL